jgi:hypothetical protein
MNTAVRSALRSLSGTSKSPVASRAYPTPAKKTETSVDITSYIHTGA